MKAPQDERRELLDEAIRVASDAMSAPVDRAVVTSRHIRCWSSAGCVTMSYAYQQGGTVDPVSGRFQPIAGSGGWSVMVVRNEPPGRLWRWLRSHLLRRSTARANERGGGNGPHPV